MKEPTIVLEAKLRGERVSPYLPEEAVEIDVTIRNVSQDPANTASLSLNLSTPVLCLYDEKGTSLFELTPQDRHFRRDGSYPIAAVDQRITLPPGKEESTWINLWKYVAPFSPGRYSVEVEHHVDAEERIRSGRVHFEIVRADVGDSALSYDSPGRGSSILAWMATPPGDKGAPRLLLRRSGASNHRFPFQGARGYDGFGSTARVALGQSPLGGSPNGTGWVAALDGGKAELIHHNMTFLVWRSGKVDFPLRGPLLLQGFPDRGHAVFLAAGTGASGAPVLMGMRVEAGAAPPVQDGAPGPLRGPLPHAPVPWSVPLSALPTRLAATFSTQGPIALLLAHDDGEATTYVRLDVEESGEVTGKERVIRTTPHVARAIDVDPWNGDEISFFVLEVDRANPSLMALVRIDPRTGNVTDEAPQEVPGYPMGRGDSPGPAKPLEMTVGVNLMDEIWISVVDTHRRAFAGRLRVGLAPVAAPSVRGHVAALLETSPGCFTQDGYLAFGEEH